jgi:hypothetical protein
VLGALIYARRTALAVKAERHIAAEPQGQLMTKVVPISPEQAMAEN